MIVNMSFVVLLNFLRVNFKVSEVTSSNPLSTTDLFDDMKNSTMPSTNTRARLLEYLLVDESTYLSHNSSITEPYPPLENLNQHISSIVSNFMETWLTAQVNTSQSSLYNQPNPHTYEPITANSTPRFGDVTFFQLWKEIGIQNNGNFTLKNKPYDNSYKSNGTNSDVHDTSRMKAILVKDTRYRSLMKKWITNRRRHGRERELDSANFNQTEMSNSSGSSLRNSSDEVIKSSCVRDNNSTSCNVSSNVDEKSSSEFDHDDPEARFYDPLMPYPEEYPEEYQTIQNGPALIISRTTYTRIPNVTYTTITMVTLPTYRLVEKAENAFAATLLDERSSKSFYEDRRCIRCETNSSLRYPRV